MAKATGAARTKPQFVRSPRLRCVFKFKGHTDKLIAGFKIPVVNDTKLAPNYCKILPSGGSEYRAFLQHVGGSMSSSRLRKTLASEFSDRIRLKIYETFDDEPEEDDYVMQHGEFVDGRRSKERAKSSSKSSGRKRDHRHVGIGVGHAS